MDYSVQKEEAGELDLHLGHRILFVVCSLPPQALIGWLGPENPDYDGGWVGGHFLSFLEKWKRRCKGVHAFHWG